jgi:Domain of unknown function (DUF4410)
MSRVLVSLMVVAVTYPTIAAQSPVKTIDDGVLDKISLFVAALDNPAKLAVVMKPFDASAAELGTGGKDGKETRQEEARTMQNEGPRVLADRFVAALMKSGPFSQVRVLKADEPVPDGVLVVDGKFVTIDPGSRTKRYLAGFGAGKSLVKVVGSVKDSTGRTLATFEQRRIGAMGFAGGDSLGKLMADSRNIGEDLAKFLSLWARGESLN